MTILNLSDSFHPLFGGKSVTRRALLKELALKHRVISISLHRQAQDLKQDGIEIHNLAWPQTGGLSDRLKIHQHLMAGVFLKAGIGKALSGVSPDLVFTDGFLGWLGVWLARQRGAKAVFFNHDFDGLCPDRAHYRDPLGCGQDCFFCTRRTEVRLTYPLAAFYRRRYIKAVNEADLVVSNSRYTGEVVKRFTGRVSEISYPMIGLDCPGNNGDELREAAIFVRPVRAKGAKLVLDLAARLSEQSFVVVGGSDDPLLERLKALPNVEWMERCQDMPRLYRRARAVLVPSLLPETFGRVAAEAMACGAVPLVSDRGALKETVGPAGIVLDPADLPAWEAALRRLSSDQGYRQGLSALGRQQARNYEGQSTMAGFRQTVRCRLGLEI